MIQLRGEITPALTAAIQRKIVEAAELDAKTVILELDTPGGYVGASTELGDFIFTQKDLRIVAYINPKAYSGGTIVALACDEIYIDESTGMMGDVAPIAVGQELGEKNQSPIRETLENYARARGYPVALVDAMVTKDYEVYRVYLLDDPAPLYVKGTDLDLKEEADWKGKMTRKELIVERGRLLTMSASKAVDYGFARKAVSSRLDLYDELGIGPSGVKQLYLNASERLLAIADSFSLLLIVAGLVLLFIEAQHPGFGLPGIAGLTCLAAFFLIKFSLNYAHMLELILFGAGAALLIIEVFLIPGFGVVGGLGITLIFVSLVLMLQNFVVPGSPSEWRAFSHNVLAILLTFLASISAVFFLARHMERVPLLSRLVQRQTMAGATAAAAAGRQGEALLRLVGKTGVAITPLHPAGRAQFEGSDVDVVTEGEFLEQGARVEVVDVSGWRVVVKARTES